MSHQIVLMYYVHEMKLADYLEDLNLKALNNGSYRKRSTRICECIP